ncbi:MAG: NlpC/P60 family protein [Paracoccaceae bacterium]
MADRRVTPFSGRVALESLRGAVDAQTFVPGEALRVIVPVADLCAEPGGALDRQLLWGTAFVAIERRDAWVFGQSDRGGYCGWLRETALDQGAEPTHWVASLATHAYPAPRVQAAPAIWLSHGSRLVIGQIEGAWAATDAGYVPAGHLRLIGDWETDPVAVAGRFLGVPYLWGGNSAAGFDCSALVQAALMACGMDCPGDSDQQRTIGTEVAGDLQRGDLIFWKGHVAMVSGPDQIIHANGHTMNVAFEGLAAATARIAAAEGSPILTRRRIS